MRWQLLCRSRFEATLLSSSFVSAIENEQSESQENPTTEIPQTGQPFLVIPRELIVFGTDGELGNAEIA